MSDPVTVAQNVSSIPATLKDIIQILSWLTAVAVAIFGVLKGLSEIKNNRNEKIEERKLAEHKLRWDQAQLAREVVAEIFGNQRVRDSIQMLDWDGINYTAKNGDEVTISHDEFMASLRINNLKFQEKEKFVRDCMDELLDGFERLEHYLRTGIVEFEDIKFPLIYHIKQLAKFKKTIDAYMKGFDFMLAIDFLSRFPEYKG